MPKVFRWQYIVAGVVLWNIQAFFGIWLNGGMGLLRTVPGALEFAFGGAFVLFAYVGPLVSRTMRSMAFRPDADIKGLTSSLLFGGFVGLFLMMGGCCPPIIWQSS